MGQGNSNFKKIRKVKNREEESSVRLSKKIQEELKEQYYLDLGDDDELETV